MLSSKNDKIHKQGWILKKAGSGIFSPWREKYLTLISTISKEYHILIYDDRDLTKPAKHQIRLSDMKIDRKHENYFLLPKGAVSFKLLTASKKFYLAAHTKMELEDWLSTINGLSSTESFEVTRSISRMMRPKSRNDDSDAHSIYSVISRDEDCVSVNSLSTRGTSREQSVASSHVDTLSFCSEPVLTPYELTLMGSDEQTTIHGDTPSNKNKKDVEPAAINESQWHQNYIEILNMNVHTEELHLAKDVQLMQFIGNFKETAIYHAKNIIDEYHVLENTEKACMKVYKRNADQSYTKNGIVFRFACDYDAATEEEIKFALAKSSAELRGNAATLKAIFDHKVSINDVPFFTVLMALVDYKGFRIIAHAELSNGKNIQRIHDLNPQRLRIDEQVCHETMSISQYLNLKPHSVQVNDDRRVKIYLSATVEIFKEDKTNNHYLTCLRDLFPLDYNYVKKSVEYVASIKNFKRLRPEFLQIYQSSLCSDGLSPMAGASKREIEGNNEDLVKAARFLKETWIPSFVKMLDNMEICPFDSASLTKEMHKRGINMRYLGYIYQLSSIPFVRQLVLVEMIARASKQIFQARFRNAIIHFRNVGATSVSDPMETYAIKQLNDILAFNERTESLVLTKIAPEIKAKFNFDMSPRHYFEVYRPALFLAIQNHCGISLDDSAEYDFAAVESVQKSDFKGFDCKVKISSGIHNETEITNAKDDDKLAYIVAKHFKSLGSNSKLLKSHNSTTVLTTVAAHYNAKGRFEEAKMYAQAAVSSGTKNTSIYALAIAQFVFSAAGLQTCVVGGPDPSLLQWYRKAIVSLSWHWGDHNPLLMTLHDRMSEIYHRAKDPEKAFEFHAQSLETAVKSLGNTHTITGAYLARAGCYLSNMGQTDQALDKFTLALEIFQSSLSDNAMIAEVHYHMADALEQKGDYDAAVENAQKCRRIREACFGFSDVRVVNSCRQVAKMILAPYKDYTGVLTPAIKAAYREAISCNEKIFRYLQNQNTLTRLKSQRSLTRKLSTNVKPAKSRKLAISGPLLELPFGWTPPFAKNLLHRLTKDIVQMKLALVESASHKECIRTLRQKRLENNSNFDPEDARMTIMKMAAVTPSVYLDDILQRVGHGDESAVEELGMVIILTESETVGFATE